MNHIHTPLARGWVVTSQTTKEAAEKLERWPMESLSGFLIHMLRREEEFLKIWREQYSYHERELQKTTGIYNIRLLRNHAQLAAALAAMRLLLPIDDRLHREGQAWIAEMMRQRQLIASSEHPVVERFWSIFDYLSEIEASEVVEPLNKSRKANEYIAVNLPHFFERCREHGQQPPHEEELKKHLRTSKARKYCDQKRVNSPSGKVFYCWVFQRPLSEQPVI